MARADILKVLYSKQLSPLEFNFEKLMIPGMHNYLAPWDLQQLNDIATSVRYNANRKLKEKEIDRIMVSRSFKRFHCGTNRVVYRHLEDPRFVAKVALDRTGLNDNPNEFKNQAYLKPFVTKVFEVSPCGTVGFVEKVEPITSREEFLNIANDVFDVLVYGLIGLYALDDVGTDFFMNWGVRLGFGPVLLDFPYVFRLDGNKLHCALPEIDHYGNRTGRICDGEIDYDEGFNYLICPKCGKQYCARDLAEAQQEKQVILKGGKDNMSLKVMLTVNGKPYGGNIPQKETKTIVETTKHEEKSEGAKIKFELNAESIVGSPSTSTIVCPVKNDTAIPPVSKPIEVSLKKKDKADEPKIIESKPTNGHGFKMSFNGQTKNIGNKPTYKKDDKREDQPMKKRPKFNRSFKATFNVDGKPIEDKQTDQPVEQVEEEKVAFVEVLGEKKEISQDQYLHILGSLPEPQIGDIDSYPEMTPEEFYSTLDTQDQVDQMKRVIYVDLQGDCNDGLIQLNENADPSTFDTSTYRYGGFTMYTFVRRTDGEIFFVLKTAEDKEFKFKNNVKSLFPKISFEAPQYEEGIEDDDEDEEDELEEEFEESDEEVDQGGLGETSDRSGDDDTGDSGELNAGSSSDEDVISEVTSGEEEEEKVKKYDTTTFEPLFPRLTNDFKRMCLRDMSDTEDTSIGEKIVFKVPGNDNVYIVTSSSENIYNQPRVCGNFEDLFAKISEVRGVVFTEAVKAELMDAIETSDEFMINLIDSHETSSEEEHTSNKVKYHTDPNNLGNF